MVTDSNHRQPVISRFFYDQVRSADLMVTGEFMKLYLIHCGFYDSQVGDGLYELHTNLFVMANSFDEAKQTVKSKPIFKRRKMHVDGMQEISAVDGYRIDAVADPLLQGETKLITSRYGARPPAPASSPLFGAAEQ